LSEVNSLTKGFQDHHSDANPLFAIPDVKLPTPVNAEVLHSFLSKCNYDESETEYLVNGILNGFSVACVKKTFQDNCKNLKSALEFPHVVSEKICKELKDNKIAGPFFHKPLNKLHVSPIGICKKKERNKYRMIFHLSHPKGDSVNDFIAEEFSTVQYTRVSDAVSGIKSFESKCYMAKTDISNAYRNLPLKPEEYHLFGFKWNNLYYYDRCLPMGCSSSCQIFERFSTGLHGIGVAEFFILTKLNIYTCIYKKCEGGVPRKWPHHKRA